MPLLDLNAINRQQAPPPTHTARVSPWLLETALSRSIIAAGEPRVHRSFRCPVRFRVEGVAQVGTLKAPFCRHCGTAIVKDYTVRTVVQGWWGLISFCFNWVCLAGNALAYRKALAFPRFVLNLAVLGPSDG